MHMQAQWQVHKNIYRHTCMHIHMHMLLPDQLLAATRATAHVMETSMQPMCVYVRVCIDIFMLHVSLCACVCTYLCMHACKKRLLFATQDAHCLFVCVHVHINMNTYARKVHYDSLLF
jgi:hypothetical protein